MLATPLFLLASLIGLACSCSTSTQSDRGSGGSGGGAAGKPIHAEGGGGSPGGQNSGAASGGEGASAPGGSGGGGTDDDLFIVPEGLSVTPLPGGNGVLNVTAFTLKQGAAGPELYVALKNAGEVPACSAGVGVDLLDETEQHLGTGMTGLLTRHFYLFRLPDGSSTVAACIPPGDVSMGAILDLPSDLVVDDVASAVYRCPYFALDVVPLGDLEINDVKSNTTGSGTKYTGTLVNQLDVLVRNPSVTIYALNRVGRPLGAAMGSGSVEIPPGGTWAFETNLVTAVGVDHAAFPAGAFADP
jgi:hypothetical protein